VPPRDDISDASQVTFYPAISNVDVEIGDGNPAAVGIRFHVAQHGYLSHMHFRIGSGLAGLMQVGNEIHDVRFSGGRYGILTENTTPYWPFTILDATFEGPAANERLRAAVADLITRSLPVTLGDMHLIDGQ